MYDIKDSDEVLLNELYLFLSQFLNLDSSSQVISSI